ncbi:MAG: pyruvate dehydrogenase component alpha subunit [Thermoplasmata archaeon]|jgi:TPP-dependent pyruvate/acetoin dehydrogenase alpha subunit|nr:pyruvate dehydrogenase component alpha subunit [Thermoplasmata archaeon]
MSKYEIQTVLKGDGSDWHHDREPHLKDDQLRAMYATMVRVRMLNERGMNLQRQGRIGFYIGSEGQEAVHVAGAAALESTDWWFPHYRDPGVALLRGATIEQMVHQLYGNAKDMTKGRQMPNHFSFRDQNFFSISSPLTVRVPQAAGAAYAMKYRKTRQIAVSSFGDGSSSEGDFHVGLNFAGVWKAPVVFLLNNNQYAISVPSSMQTASETYAQKAEAYGFEGVRVDGNDALAVYAAMKMAADKARAGKGPTLVEAYTFRMGPHSSSDDPKRYVNPNDLQFWGAKDPILRLRNYMVKKGVWSDAQEKELVDRTKQEIQAAVEAAEATPLPELRELITDVYAEVPWHLEAELKELQESVEE